MGVYGYVLAGVTVVLVVVITGTVPKSSRLDAIPTFGANGWLGSWWARLKYLTNGAEVIQKGYEKHKAAPFKVAGLRGWLVVVNGREHVEELQRAPADILSFAEGLNDASRCFPSRLQLDHIMGSDILRNLYHVSIVRSQLTRNIGVLYPGIRDEIIAAFDDVLDLKGDEWKSVPALSRVQQVVCRANNRVFVGLPLCRDSEWIDLNIRYTINVSRGSAAIALFPDSLKSMAIRLFTNLRQSEQRARKLLGPIIEKRQNHLKELGHEWTDKPNDFLSLLMEAGDPELMLQPLTIRVLTTNVAAIHTSSSSFTHALFYLAANPQYIQPLRDEVEGIVAKEGWSKTALVKMRKVDSFLRECQHIEGINSVSLLRKAMKDFTFSDGTFVPRGTVIATAARYAHHNEAFYENALAFEPFRFAPLIEGEGEGAKHQYVSTSAEYLPFGHGRQACPGRFLAAAVLKTMLAHIVMTYDIKLEDGTTRPKAFRLVTSLLPDPRVRVLFRRRHS